MLKAEKVLAIIGVCIFLFSFFYGGLYTDLYLEGEDFSIGNILLALMGALIGSVMAYILLNGVYFGVCSIYNNLRKK